MAPSGGGSDAYFFEVHKDGVFNFVPLSYENGHVFHWRLPKEKKMDYASMCLKIIEGGCDAASMYQFADPFGTIKAGNLQSPDKRVVDKCKSPVKKKVDKGKGLLKKTVDKGKSKVLVDDIPVEKHVRRNNGIVIEENVNPSTMVTDSDSESEPEHEFNYTLYTDSESHYPNKSIDYLSEGENELIDLRKRKTEAKQAPKTSNRQTFPVNEGTSTCNSRYTRVYGVGDSETVMDHEEFMDDLMRKLRDEGDGMTDPVKIVESKVKKYPIHDVETHWQRMELAH
nr:pentatricopeptide repeat-containing protein [Tanacetum cinerariifolium]